MCERRREAARSTELIWPLGLHTLCSQFCADGVEHLHPHPAATAACSWLFISSCAKASMANDTVQRTLKPDICKNIKVYRLCFSFNQRLQGGGREGGFSEAGLVCPHVKLMHCLS